MPPDSSWMFHHLGLACRTMDAEERTLIALGYRRESLDYDDPALGIRCCFLTAPGAPRLELVVQRLGSTVLESWLAQGVKLYHMAYCVPDLDAALTELKQQRARVLVSPTPAIAFGMKPVSFVMLPNMLLVELIAGGGHNAS